MAEPRFVHLRVHSDYSMIDGLAKTGPLVKKAASLGMPALAITDFTNLCGLVKFYGTGHGAGIKPIVGADFHVQCDLLGDEFTELTVLAANNTGYQNLTLLISRAYQRGYGALGPWIDRDWLVEHQEGLILLSGGRKGDVGVSLIRGNMPLVEQCVAFYEEHFPDRYFLELIRTGRQDEEAYLHAAVALAECVAGVTELFVEQMNTRAKELGMTDTHFVNCTGLPAEGHVTSAWDIALMSRELIEKHPDIRRYTTIWMDTLRDGTFQLANTNKLIRFYDGATGLKTGSTDSAKYCLSATAEREGMELIAVVLKSPTGQQRFEDAKALLNYGFSTYALLHTVPEEPFPAIPVVLGETETVQPCIDPQKAVALVQKSQAGGLSQSVTLAEQVEAPVSAGQELGTLTLTDAAGETVQSIPIRAAQSVERLTFGTMLRRMLSAAFFAG